MTQDIEMIEVNLMNDRIKGLGTMNRDTHNIGDPKGTMKEREATMRKRGRIMANMKKEEGMNHRIEAKKREEGISQAMKASMNGQDEGAQKKARIGGHKER